MTVKYTETFSKDKNNNDTLSEVVLDGVKVAYVKMAKPELKYNSNDELEYSLNFFLNEDDADKWSETFKKASVKKIKTADFEGKYKFQPPFPKDKNQYVVRAAVTAQMKNEEGQTVLMPHDYTIRPKVYIKNSTGKLEDITKQDNVGNGSEVVIKFAVTSNSFGTFPYLRGVLVKDLVEFVKSSGQYNPFAEFGELDESQAQESPKQELAKEEPQQAPTQDPFADEVSDDDFIPF